MEPLFEIGQKVVAIRNHSMGDYKKGEEFTVLKMQSFCCFIGIKIIEYSHKVCSTHCTDCNITHNNLDTFYYDQNNFAPLRDIGNMTYEDAIKLVTPQVLII